ncbi:MAG: hypothetical protein J0M20_17830, partial [Burkholderiales bacterium]|nr:hypothetical protein [Burkholderiales bacterium]
WDASPERTALLRQVSGERVLRELIGDTLKAASGHGGDLRAAMAKLRPKRSQWGVALKHLDRAQKAPKFSWNIAYSAPIWDMDIPKFSGSLDLARVASAEALFLAAEGKSNEAEARLAQVLWLADRYAGAGAVVPVLASVAIDHFVWTAATPLFAAGKGQGLTEAKVVDLRLALKYAMDREAMVQTVLQGYGTVGNDFPINKAYDLFPEGIEQRAYDPEQAASYYKKSGHSGPVLLRTSDVAFAGAVEQGRIRGQHHLVQVRRLLGVGQHHLDRQAGQLQADRMAHGGQGGGAAVDGEQVAHGTSGMRWG